jgi:hypothetical protein
MPRPGQAAIAHVGLVAADGNETSSTSITLTPVAQLDAGNVGLVSVAVDNTGTVNADHSEISSVGDSVGNSYSKLKEFTIGQGAAGSGITVSLWYTRAATNLTTSGTLTVNFANTVTAKAVVMEEFTVGNALTVAGSNQNTNLGNGWGSLTISGLASAEYLFFRACAKESGSNTQLTPTTSYTAITHRRSGTSGTSSVGIWGEFRIVTATSETSNPTLVASADSASVMVALVETAAVTPTPRRRIFISGLSVFGPDGVFAGLAGYASDDLWAARFGFLDADLLE